MFSRNYALKLICALLVLSSLTSTENSVGVAAQDPNEQPLGGKNRILNWLPKCFRGAEGIDSIISCVQENADPQCVEDVGITIPDIVQCVNETITSLPPIMGQVMEQRQGMGQGQGTPRRNFRKAFMGAAIECLDPYITCVKDSIQERVNGLPTCVRETLKEFKQCGRVNRATCRETCEGSRPETNPFSELTADSFTTCDGIQTNLVDPSCQIVNCCEPCTEEYEAVMNCVVNDVLEEVPESGEECSLACPTASVRQLRFVEAMKRAEKDAVVHERTLQTASDGDDSSCLEFSPGLTGANADELEARSEVFLPCIYEEYFDTIEAQEEDDNGEDESSSMSTFPLGKSLSVVGLMLLGFLL